MHSAKQKKNRSLIQDTDNSRGGSHGTFAINDNRESSFAQTKRIGLLRSSLTMAPQQQASESQLTIQPKKKYEEAKEENANVRKETQGVITEESMKKNDAAAKAEIAAKKAFAERKKQAGVGSIEEIESKIVGNSNGMNLTTGDAAVAEAKDRISTRMEDGSPGEQRHDGSIESLVTRAANDRAHAARGTQSETAKTSQHTHEHKTREILGAAAAKSADDKNTQEVATQRGKNAKLQQDRSELIQLARKI